MRHIPEDELHAYLDQALSRSQCVEIESHLAECPACRRERDAIAALRDRTTALLATLVPGRATPPPFELIESRRAAAVARREHRVRRAMWAASLVGAVGLGWGLSQIAGRDVPPAVATAPGAALQPTPGLHPERAGPVADTGSPAALAQAPEAAATGPSGDAPAARSGERPPAEPAGSRLASGPGTARPASAQSDGAAVVRFGITEPFAAPRSLQVSSSGLPEGLALDGLWRTVSWENAREEAGGSPAHVDGLPVVQVQVQQAASGKPLMVVAQQLGTGDVIRTIEGPAADVSSLLRRATRPGTSPWPTVEPGDDGAVTSTDGSIVTMQGDRILAISAPGMSSDSLAAIARRVNASRSR